MGNVRLTVYARSDVGRVRTNNEDAFLVSDLDTGASLAPSAVDVDVRDRGLLAVVSDGMGGHAAGDVASALVVESLRKSLSDPAADHSSLQRLIDGAVRRANADVHAAARATERRGMGATLTAVLVHGTDAYVAEVGDSRGYLLRSGRLRQITKDQSFVQVLIDAGVLTPEQAKDSPQKNVILQAMGREQDVQVSIGRIRLHAGDRLLLCSDGLSNLVTAAELAAMLGDDAPATVCERMIALANERGGHDNLTAVVALVGGDGLPAPEEAEPSRQTIEILQEYAGAKLPPRTPPPPSGSPPEAATSSSGSPPAIANPSSGSPPAAAKTGSGSPPPAEPASAPLAAPQAQPDAGPPWLALALVAVVALVALLAWRLLS